MTRKIAEKHGDTHNPLYKKWRTMRLRIKYPETNGYENYGGRGIKICERWDSYLNFKEDMGPTFVVGLALDRKDPNGDYCPENCHWASPLSQQRSKRKHLMYNGEFVIDYARRMNMPYWQAAYYYKKYGSPEPRNN